MQLLINRVLGGLYSEPCFEGNIDYPVSQHTAIRFAAVEVTVCERSVQPHPLSILFSSTAFSTVHLSLVGLIGIVDA